MTFINQLMSILPLSNKGYTAVLYTLGNLVDIVGSHNFTNLGGGVNFGSGYIKIRGNTIGGGYNYVNINNYADFDFIGDFKVEFTFYGDGTWISIPSDITASFLGNHNTTTLKGWWIIYYNGKFYFGYNNGESVAFSYILPDPTLSYNIIISVVNNIVYFYINDVLIGTPQNIPTIQYDTTLLWIGASPQGTQQYSNWYLTKLKISKVI